MFVLPIVDLWTMKPTAYALTDEDGIPIVAKTPVELYYNIIAALERDFKPLVVCMPRVMKSSWRGFVEQFPEPIWVYDAGKVMDDMGNTVMIDDGEVAALWQRGIGSQQDLKKAQESGVHYGSGTHDGVALMGTDELRIAPGNLYKIQWG